MFNCQIQHMAKYQHAHNLRKKKKNKKNTSYKNRYKLKLLIKKKSKV